MGITLCALRITQLPLNPTADMAHTPTTQASQFFEQKNDVIIWIYTVGLFHERANALEKETKFFFQNPQNEESEFWGTLKAEIFKSFVWNLGRFSKILKKTKKIDVLILVGPVKVEIFESV